MLGLCTRTAEDNDGWSSGEGPRLLSNLALLGAHLLGLQRWTAARPHRTPKLHSAFRSPNALGADHGSQRVVIYEQTSTDRSPIAQR